MSHVIRDDDERYVSLYRTGTSSGKEYIALNIEIPHGSEECPGMHVVFTAEEARHMRYVLDQMLKEWDV